MSHRRTESGQRERANHDQPNDESKDGVDRRKFLKRASGAGAGMGLLQARLDRATADGTVQFGTVGVRHRIEDDVDPEYVEDCAPPRWQLFDGDLVFFTFYLDDEELGRLADGGSVVLGRNLHSLPAADVPLGQTFHLPTGLGPDLQPRRGVLYDGSYSVPTPRIDAAGSAIEVAVDGASERVAPGQESALELVPRTVGLRQYERRRTGETKADGEAEEGVVYEQTTVEATVVPEVRARNYGELSYYSVSDRVEVN